MKTVKQIADELGVSKQAVFKKIDNLCLRQQLTKSNNQWLIPENIEKTIKEAFSSTNKSPTVLSIDSSTVDGLIDMLRNELDIKNRQLAEKDKQINILLERLAEDQRLIDQQQQLQAMAVLEEKKQEENEENQNQQSETEEKKSFFRRIFGS